MNFRTVRRGKVRVSVEDHRLATFNECHLAKEAEVVPAETPKCRGLLFVGAQVLTVADLSFTGSGTVPAGTRGEIIDVRRSSWSTRSMLGPPQHRPAQVREHSRNLKEFQRNVKEFQRSFKESKGNLKKS